MAVDREEEEFWFNSVQTTRVICSSKGDIPVEPEHSAPTRDLARDLGSAKEGISRLENFNLKNFESESHGQSG